MRGGCAAVSRAGCDTIGVPAAARTATQREREPRRRGDAEKDDLNFSAPPRLRGEVLSVLQLAAHGAELADLDGYTVAVGDDLT
jgi:hypothetical protein